MKFRINIRRPVSKEIKRILMELNLQSIELLNSKEEDLDEPIHDARKNFKKIRAVIRLVRPEIGEEAYQRENIFHRDIGRKLSDIRDSYVFVETLDKLNKRFKKELSNDSAVVTNFRNALIARHDKIKDEIIYNKKAHLEVAEELKQHQPVISGLPIQHDDFSAIEGGLKKVYFRGYHAIRRCVDDSSAENFHDWRKRVKYLWYHMRLLYQINPRKQKVYSKQLKELSDYLGDEHDLTVMQELLESENLLENEPEFQQKLEKLIKIRKFELRADAFKSAQTIYQHPPDEFTERVKSQWYKAL